MELRFFWVGGTPLWEIGIMVNLLELLLAKVWVLDIWVFDSLRLLKAEDGRKPYILFKLQMLEYKDLNRRLIVFNFQTLSYYKLNEYGT